MSDVHGPVGGNPNTIDASQRSPSGERTGRPLRIYLGGPKRTAAMSAPDSRKKCVVVDLADRVEFIVRAPDGVTAYTIHYGRWVSGPVAQDAVAPAALDGWLEMGSLAVTGAVDGALARVVFETGTDPVGIYVANFTGSTTANHSFAFWYRGLPGTP